MVGHAHPTYFVPEPGRGALPGLAGHPAAPGGDLEGRVIGQGKYRGTACHTKLQSISYKYSCHSERS